MLNITEVLNRFIGGNQQPVDGKSEVDLNVLQGLENNRNSFFQSQGQSVQPQQMQAPNPYQLNVARNLVALKNDYANAQSDEQRQNASALANRMREIANNAGLNMDAYGSNVTLEDATSNLASQEARDVLGALQGQYSMTSDQYYQKMEDDLFRQGYSARQAKKFAGKMAREYQANRVAYLDGVYNGYGRDGHVTNALGNQFLGAMAMENPMLANFYAQVYPNAQDAYRRENQVADLMMSHGFDLEKMLAAFGYNSQLANQNAELARETHAANSAVDEQRNANQQQRAFDFRRQELQLQQELAPKGQGRTSGGNEQQQFNMLKDLRAGALERLKQLQKEAEGYNSIGQELPVELQNQIAQANADYDDITSRMHSIANLNGEEPRFKGSGHWTENEDISLMNQLREEGKKRGLTWYQIKVAAYYKVLEDTGDKEYALGAAGLDKEPE